MKEIWAVLDGYDLLIKWVYNSRNVNINRPCLSLTVRPYQPCNWDVRQLFINTGTLLWTACLPLYFSYMYKTYRMSGKFAFWGEGGKVVLLNNFSWKLVSWFQWRTQEFFFVGGGFDKFSWGQRTERTGIWRQL